MTEPPPTVPIERQSTLRLDAVSIVWIVPLIALVAAAFIAWQAYVERGPLIQIRFDSASGILEAQTELRFRDVAVGVVEDVLFTEGLAEVAVFVRVDQTVAPYIDEDAQFWIVSPEVSARGITGLDTVFSGVYIEGLWDETQSQPASIFQGLDEPPLSAFEQGGLRIQLRATGDTELTDEIPILYRGIEVGQMGRVRITQDGSAAFADAIIFEPYDRLVTTNTRFWDVSGIGFSLGAAGAEVQFGSIAAILSGGITFDTLISGGVPVDDGVVYQVYDDELSARASVFNQSDGTPLQLSVVFEENIAGLTVGAPVELGGVRIGEVTNLTGVVNPDRFGDARVRLQTSLTVQPSRLGLPGEGTPDAALRFLAERVEAGLRARLATASILTGGLKIELVLDPNAPPAILDVDQLPFPAFPSTTNNVADLSASAEGVLTRVGNLPIEELLENAILFLDTTTALIGSDDIRAVPGEVLGLVSDARDIVGSDDAQAVAKSLTATLAELQSLLAELNEQEVADRLMTAFSAVEKAAGDFSASVDGVPQLIARIDAIAASAQSVPLQTLANEMTALLESADALIGSQDARDLPGSLGEALDQLAAVLTDLREGGATENLNATLASTRVAADSIAASTEDLPEIIARLSATLQEASETLESIGQGSDFNRDTRSALRAVQDAARDVSSLARAIERNPNSLITGR